jgi:E3 ubiquitin-protein ligase SIAH1
MDAVGRDISEGVLTELECPVCMEYMLPPIELCKNGHNICSNCRLKLQECPTCRNRFVNIRNLALENLTKRVKYPCTNRKFGCKEEHSVDFIKTHQELCPYTPYVCPFIKDKKCAWADLQSKMKRHLLECHCEDVREQAEETCVVINTDSVELRGCKVIFAYNEIFYVDILRKTNSYCIAVRCVGTPENSSKYGYRISFKKADEIESITVCHVIHSASENLDQIYESGNCFNLPFDLLKRFVTHDADLPYKLKIVKK